jgi:hypothetical protein
MDFLQSSFSGFFAAKLSRMAVTSTACAGAAAGEEEVAEAVGIVLVGVAAATAVLGGASAAELGAAAGDEDVAEAAGAFGLVGVSAATVVVGEATAVATPLEGAAVACPNIFDMRLVNIPIGVKYAPHWGKKPASLAAYPPQLFDWNLQESTRCSESELH